MRSEIIKKHLLELIHFECEDMNYFENPFSSDFETIVYDIDEIDTWHTMDSSTTDKPMTIILDLEAIKRGVYTGGVRGVYLIDININILKTYEGAKNLEEQSEYFAFKEINYKIIKEVDSPVDERSFGYAEGFKERILELISQYQ